MWRGAAAISGMAVGLPALDPSAIPDWLTALFTGVMAFYIVKDRFRGLRPVPRRLEQRGGMEVDGVEA